MLMSYMLIMSGAWPRIPCIFRPMVLSTVLSLTDRTQKPSPAVELPTQGELTISRQGSRLPFVPTRDERFWGSMLKFYNDLPIESVSQAKKEAKDASLLVLAELAKRDETAEARQEREVASTPFWPLRANVCMLQKTHFVKTHNLLWASVAFSDLDDDGRLERSKSVWRQEQSRQRKKKNFEKQPLPCRRIWRALFWSTP